MKGVSVLNLLLLADRLQRFAYPRVTAEHGNEEGEKGQHEVGG